MESSTTRRSLLSSFAALVATSALAGCEQLSSGQVAVWVINNSERPHTIEVTISIDGEEQFNQRIDIQGEPNPNTSAEATTRYALTNLRYGTEYDVTAELENGSRSNDSFVVDCSGTTDQVDLVQVRIRSDAVSLQEDTC